MAEVPSVTFAYKRPEGRSGKFSRSAAEDLVLQSTSSSSAGDFVPARPKWAARPMARSRSPFRVGLPGLREQAPGRREQRRASAPDLEDPHQGQRHFVC